MRNPLSVLGIRSEDQTTESWGLLRDPDVHAEWERRNDALNAGDEELQRELSSPDVQPPDVVVRALNNLRKESS